MSDPVNAVPPKMAAAARTELETLLRLLGFEAQVTAYADDPTHLLLQIQIADPGALIGREARVLDALQYMLNRILFARLPDAPHCTVDVNLYRERRRDRLLRWVNDALSGIEETGRPRALPPLRAFERKIVHQLVAAHPGYRTESEPTAEEGLKTVLIFRADDQDTPESPLQPL